jgi:hypothetical protein
MPAAKPKPKPITSLADLTPDPQNANTGTERGGGMLERSLRETGAGRSVLVDKHGRIIAGNKAVGGWGAIAEPEQIEVVRTTGQKLVVVQREDLDLDDPHGLARKLAYFDNRTAELNLFWDPAQVYADMQAGLDLTPFWTTDELAAVVGELSQGGAPGPPEPPEPEIDRAEALRQHYGVEPGQLWRCEEHRILCGDCRDAAGRERLLAGLVPDLLIADPPYGVSIVHPTGYVGGGEDYAIPFGGLKGPKGAEYTARKGQVGRHLSKPRGHGKRAGDGTPVIEVGKYAPVIGDETIATAVETATLLLAAYPTAIQVWWGANHYAAALPNSSGWLVWDKETTGDFADCELAWTNQPKAARLFHHRWNGMLRASERDRRWHPTQKPAALMAWVYETVAPDARTVFDPFLGCGPTLMAAEQTGRTLYACELAPEYVAVSLQRWATMTGGTPQLLEA